MATAQARRGELRVERPSGVAVAALTSAMLGLLAMALVNLGTEASEPLMNTIHALGKLWIPGAQGIGPYSGKETVALVVWLVSWAVMHVAIGKRQLDERVWGVVFLVGMGVATTLFWPPVIHLLLG